MNPIVHRNLRKIERTDAVKARNIDAKLVRVRTPLMMGIDSADRTEIVLRCPSVELVERELVGALHHLQTIKRRGDSDCAAHPAERAVAPAGSGQSVRQFHPEPDAAAMTTAFPEAFIYQGCQPLSRRSIRLAEPDDASPGQ